MRDPLVTIVTPSFNQAEFIGATIESVLSQDYPRIEYIVMDGGSSDGTAAIAAGYAGRLEWISEPDHGQTHAINKGFQRARGEIVAWLNSDDILLPGAVSAAVDAFRRSPDTGAVYGGGCCIDRQGSVTMRFPATESFNLWKLNWLCDYILQQATFFRRSALEDAGWLDESLHWTMDWDILTRLGRRFGLTYVPRDLGCLREYGETKTASGGAARFREIRALLRRQTGSRWAPGCWYYGLDTYGKTWREAIRRCGVGPLRLLAGPLADLVFMLSRYKLDMAELHSQGHYCGGWAGRRMYWMLPRGRGPVEVRGEVPEWLGWNLRLRVSSGGRVLSERSLPPGPFEWRFDAGDAADALSLRFDAPRAARGARGSGAPGRIPVAWRLYSIGWAR
ncbi:MAG: glycosyltransferase [Candidatus Solibacter usitatus]|nr:glycosyltransferase [Candidatus Solibacter usitatus]